MFSIDLHNILALGSQHHSFNHYAIWVGTFKHLNVKLQTSKSSKNGSDRKAFTLSTKSRWFQATLASELLQQSHENG